MIENPIYMQNLTYPARLDRGKTGAMFAEGVLTGFTVAQRGAGANMSVDVAAGKAFVQGDDQTDQGVYYVRSTATENVTVSASPGSNSRIDIVVLKINDPNATGTPGDNAEIQVIAGTAAASPVPPATPDSALLLATIGPILTSTTSITNAMISNVATTATLAYDVVDDANATRLGTSTATASAVMRRDANGRVEIVNGTTSTQAVTLGYVDGGSGTLASSTVRYYKSGSMVHVWTTPAWNAAAATLPAGFRPAATVGTPLVDGSAVGTLTIATTGVLSGSIAGGASGGSFSAHFQAA